MADVEVAIGSKDIMRMLGWSKSKLFKRLPRMRELGVVFYKREGKPPRLTIKAFPSRIQRYTSLCGDKQTPL